MTMCLSLVTTYMEIQATSDSIYVSKSTQSFSDLKVIVAVKIKFEMKHAIAVILTNVVCWFRRPYLKKI